MNPVRRTLLFCGIVMVAGCGDLGPRVCTLQARFGLLVRVRDATTGRYAAAGAAVVVRDGAFQDSVTAQLDTMTVRAALERPGEYSISVQKPGYTLWRSSAHVTSDRCHVQTVVVDARLVRAP